MRFASLGNSASRAFLHASDASISTWPRTSSRTGVDTLGRRGGRRRAQIGRQIAKRHIGFMADSGNDRLFAHRYRADDALLVERPQILHRAAAPRHDDDADVFQPLEQPNGSDATSSSAPTPCTRTGQSRMRASGLRRSDTFRMS